MVMGEVHSRKSSGKVMFAILAVLLLLSISKANAAVTIA